MPLKVLALVVKQLSWTWTVCQQAKASASVQLKCMPIAVRVCKHQLLVRIFAIDASYDPAIWSSLCPAFSAYDMYSLTEKIQR